MFQTSMAFGTRWIVVVQTSLVLWVSSGYTICTAYLVERINTEVENFAVLLSCG